jgi:heat shock protein HslJ
MMGLRSMVAVSLMSGLAACQGDETISGYADTEAVYQLEELAGAAFNARATIALPEEGTGRGEPPCNTWSAAQSAPYPWLELGPIAATKRACPDLDAETRFFEALGAMSLAEVQGDILILSGDTDATMVFRRAP